jgi:hypothetical protein
MNPMVISILKDEAAKIVRFNEEGQHYDVVSREIYRVLHQLGDPFVDSYLPYVIAGLATFDIGRMMGYSHDNGNFVRRLKAKYKILKPLLEPLLSFDLLSIDLQDHGDEIRQAYNILSSSGYNALHKDPAKSFHVGATKLLHFLRPELFIIVDSNAARAFKAAYNIPFRNTTQPGYSAHRYCECMKLAKKDITGFGSYKFKALEPGTPITRIYDKLTFITGSMLE